MIEEMKLEDLDEILLIEEEVFTSRWTKDQFIYELTENEFSKLFCLKEDGKIIGYAGIWFLFERAEITSIAIKKEYQGRGYGTMLMEHLINSAIKQSCDLILLEVRPSNEKAIGLYHKLGFENLRIRKDYYQDNHEDCIEMMKIIGGINEENIGN